MFDPTMFGRTKWETQSQTNTITGSIPLRFSNIGASRTFHPICTRNYRQNRGPNVTYGAFKAKRHPMQTRSAEKSEANQNLNLIDKQRYDLFDKLKEENKDKLLRYAKAGVTLGDEENVRKEFGIEANEYKGKSFKDMYDWMVSINAEDDDSVQETESEYQPENTPAASQLSGNSPPVESDVTEKSDGKSEIDQDRVPNESAATNVAESQRAEHVPNETPEPVSNETPEQETPEEQEEEEYDPFVEDDDGQADDEDSADEATEKQSDIKRSPKKASVSDRFINALLNRPPENDEEKLEPTEDYDPEAYDYYQDPRNFPFRSKFEQYKKLNPFEDVQIAEVKDVHSRKRDTRKLHRPSYSTRPNSYQIDIMFAVGTRTDPCFYLVMININTRFLMVKRIADKGTEIIMREISNFIDENGLTIDYMNGDGEKGFIGMQNNLEAYWQSKKDGTTNQQTVFTDSNGEILSIYKHQFVMRFEKNDFTFHNKLVDSVIRTIRNACGLNPDVLRSEEIVERIVKFYNTTPHTGLLKNKKGRHYTPLEMQQDRDLEWEYIRAKDVELRSAVKNIEAAKLSTYKKGNVLRLHLNWAKTKNRFRKRRMVFENVGVFHSYVNGNARVWVLELGEYRDVPIFFTDKIAEDPFNIPKSYRDYYQTNLYIEDIPEELLIDTTEHKSKEGQYVVPEPTEKSPEKSLKKAPKRPIRSKILSEGERTRERTEDQTEDEPENEPEQEPVQEPVQDQSEPEQTEPVPELDPYNLLNQETPTQPQEPLEQYSIQSIMN